jgi:hypothetical protein
LEGAEFFTREPAALRLKMLSRIEQFNVSSDKLTGMIETSFGAPKKRTRRIPSTAGS